MDVQRNFKVQVHDSLKVAAQIDWVLKKVYGIFFFTEFKTLVRLHLEYGIQLWMPHNRNNVEILERVQKKFTMMLSEMGVCAIQRRLTN